MPKWRIFSYLNEYYWENSRLLVIRTILQRLSDSREIRCTLLSEAHTVTYVCAHTRTCMITLINKNRHEMVPIHLCIHANRTILRGRSLSDRGCWHNQKHDHSFYKLNACANGFTTLKRSPKFFVSPPENLKLQNSVTFQKINFE